MNRKVNSFGTTYEIIGAVDDWETGERMVVFREALTIEQMLDRGCRYDSAREWVISAQKFREYFNFGEDSEV